MSLLTFFGVAPWKAKGMPKGKPSKGAHVEPDPTEEALTPEEIYARQSDLNFAKQVTAAMDRYRDGARFPAEYESDYDVHGWQPGYRIFDW